MAKNVVGRKYIITPEGGVEEKPWRRQVRARALVAALAVAFPLVMCLAGMLLNLWWGGR
jgi:hypothetical protein